MPFDVQDGRSVLPAPFRRAPQRASPIREHRVTSTLSPVVSDNSSPAQLPVAKLLLRDRLRGRIRLGRFAWVLALLGLAAASFLLGRSQVEERLFAKRWGVVVPGRVYRSGQISRFLTEDVFRERGIATVIDLAGFERHNADQLVEMAVAEYLEIEHHRLPLAGDGTGNARKYVDAVALIAERERQGKPVLVHCAAGSYRTGGVIAVYRLLVRGDSPQCVMDEMAAYDCTPADNPKLLTYLNGNMAYFAQELVARNVLSRMPDEIPQLRP
jgi:hypothetical protein